MIELCLDTSASTTLALVRDGEVVGRAHNDSARRHAESITPMVREVLAGAGITGALAGALDAVSVGTGPAPFTGLRAGLVSARVLARASGARLAGASSLDILARQALDLLPSDVEVVVATDARRHELYWGHYRAQGPDDVEPLGGPEVGTPGRLANSLASSRAVLVVANGVAPAARDLVPLTRTAPGLDLDPAVLARLVAARLSRGETDRLGTDPLYLRRPDIQGRPTERL